MAPDLGSVGASSAAQLRIYTQAVARDEAADEARRALRTVFDHVPVGIVWAKAIRDAAGGIVDFELLYTNALAAAVLGAPADDLTGRRCSAVHPGAEGDAWRALTARVVADAVPFQADRYRVEVHGTTQDVSVGVVPYDDGYIAWCLPLAPLDPTA
jgi:PAS domain-containing protein